MDTTTTLKDILGAILFLLLIWGTSYLFLMLESVWASVNTDKESACNWKWAAEHRETMLEQSDDYPKGGFVKILKKGGGAKNIQLNPLYKWKSYSKFFR